MQSTISSLKPCQLDAALPGVFNQICLEEKMSDMELDKIHNSNSIYIRKRIQAYQ